MSENPRIVSPQERIPCLRSTWSGLSFQNSLAPMEKSSSGFPGNPNAEAAAVKRTQTRKGANLMGTVNLSKTPNAAMPA